LPCCLRVFLPFSFHFLNAPAFFFALSSWLDYYKGKTVDELKDACRKFHLKTSGDKESLVKRLASQMSPR
jgi:hypothetical protein